MKKISLCTLQIPLDVVELTFTGSRSMSCSKTKPTLEKQHKSKSARTEWDLNREGSAFKSSTLPITPQKTSHLVCALYTYMYPLLALQ